jgi:hypothetical protein
VAVGGEAGEFGAGAGAAGGAVVGFAGAEDEVAVAVVEFDVVDFGVALVVDGLAEGPGVVGQGVDGTEAGAVGEEEPVAARGDVAGDEADAGDFDDGLGGAVAGDVGDGYRAVGVEGGGDFAGGFRGGAGRGRCGRGGRG